MLGFSKVEPTAARQRPNSYIRSTVKDAPVEAEYRQSRFESSCLIRKLSPLYYRRSFVGRVIWLSRLPRDVYPCMIVKIEVISQLKSCSAKPPKSQTSGQRCRYLPQKKYISHDHARATARLRTAAAALRYDSRHISAATDDLKPLADIDSRSKRRSKKSIKCAPAFSNISMSSQPARCMNVSMRREYVLMRIRVSSRFLRLLSTLLKGVVSVVAYCWRRKKGAPACAKLSQSTAARQRRLFPQCGSQPRLLNSLTTS